MIKSIDKNKCTGCGICVGICNMDVLRLDKNDCAFIAYHEDCMTCFQCELNCPVEAITVSFEPGFVPPSIIGTGGRDNG